MGTLKDYIEILENNIDYIENAGLDELDEMCNDLGQSSLDGYVYAIEKVISDLKEIAYADTICGYAE